MEAVRFHEYGDVDVLAVEEIETPTPGEGELLLQVRAAGVNPIDWKVLHGRLAGGEPLARGPRARRRCRGRGRAGRAGCRGPRAGR